MGLLPERMKDLSRSSVLAPQPPQEYHSLFWLAVVLYL